MYFNWRVVPSCRYHVLRSLLERKRGIRLRPKEHFLFCGLISMARSICHDAGQGHHSLQNCAGLALEFFFPVFISQTHIAYLLSGGHYKGGRALPSRCFRALGEAQEKVTDDNAQCSFCDEV